jgi:hypothetical protein
MRWLVEFQRIADQAERSRAGSNKDRQPRAGGRITTTPARDSSGTPPPSELRRQGRGKFHDACQEPIASPNPL